MALKIEVRKKDLVIIGFVFLVFYLLGLLAGSKHSFLWLMSLLFYFSTCFVEKEKVTFSRKMIVMLAFLICINPFFISTKKMQFNQSHKKYAETNNKTNTTTYSAKEYLQHVIDGQKEYFGKIENHVADIVNKFDKQPLESDDGLFNGVIVLEDKAGNVESEVPFVNGVPEGIVYGYYPDGQKLMEYVLINGQIDGVMKEFHENGDLAAETNYSKGKKNGLRKIYTKKGQLEKVIPFKNDEVNGIIRIFVENKVIIGEAQNSNQIATARIYKMSDYMDSNYYDSDPIRVQELTEKPWRRDNLGPGEAAYLFNKHREEVKQRQQKYEDAQKLLWELKRNSLNK